MADDYGYPSDLDSDDGSILWDQESRSDDADSLVTSLDSLSLDGGSPPPVGICIVCLARPIYSKNGRTYSTCGMRCAAILQSATQGAVASSGTAGRGFHTHGPDGARARIPKIPRPPCVICKKNPSYRGAVTCGLTCLEKLAKDGGDPTMCNYCHRKPKHGSYPQCGTTCAEKAKLACLFCRCRPRLGRYHLCGRTCKRLAVKQTPLLLEAPKGHATYEMVEQRFIKAWITNSSGPRPAISKVFKIIENEDFLKPYDAYRRRVKNEQFRYHGTRRVCNLGKNDGTNQTTVCANATCAVCCILKTSFKVSLANAGGAFGPGVYSSTASNKAYSYCGQAGAMLLTKVVLGNIHYVNGFAQVRACPPGHDSVVFDRMGGGLNETIVYSDDAIRPVFLITFS